MMMMMMISSNNYAENLKRESFTVRKIEKTSFDVKSKS